MEGRLFEDLVVSRAHGRRGGGAGIPFSVAVHAGALAGLVALSLAVPDDLPTTAAAVVDHFPPSIVVAAPAARAAAPTRPADPSRPRAPRTTARELSLPQETQEIVPDPFAPEETSGAACTGCGVDDGAAGPGLPDGVFGGGPGGDVTAETPRPPLRVGGEVHPPRKVRHVDPVYPELARRAGVTGMVILECVIDREGRVRAVTVLRGHPLLNAAAAEAVGQWTYRPTLLNGVPVEIVMVVTVRFTTR